MGRLPVGGFVTGIIRTTPTSFPADRLSTTSPGSRLGPYELAGLLGAGGMGEVYRGRDTRLDRAVAIKRLPPALASDPEARSRLEREARAIAALNDPHICTLYDVGHDDQSDYLVMELVEGETLASRIERGRCRSTRSWRLANRSRERSSAPIGRGSCTAI